MTVTIKDTAAAHGLTFRADTACNIELSGPAGLIWQGNLEHPEGFARLLASPMGVLIHHRRADGLSRTDSDHLADALQTAGVAV